MFFKKKEKINVDDYLAYMAIIEDQLKLFLINIKRLIHKNDKNDQLRWAWDNIFLISLTNINEAPTYNALIANLDAEDETFEVSIKLLNLHLLIGSVVPRHAIEEFKDNFYKTMLLDIKIDKNVLNTLVSKYPFIYLFPRLSFLWLQEELQ